MPPRSEYEACAHKKAGVAARATTGPIKGGSLELNDLSSNRHPALHFWWSMTPRFRVCEEIPRSFPRKRESSFFAKCYSSPHIKGILRRVLDPRFRGDDRGGPISSQPLSQGRMVATLWRPRSRW